QAFQLTVELLQLPGYLDQLVLPSLAGVQLAFKIQGRPQPGEQLGQTDGLGEEVARPGCEGPFQDLLIRGAGDDQDGNVLQRRRRLDAPTNLDAIQVGQADIQQDDLNAVGRGGRRAFAQQAQGVAAGGDGRHLLVAPALEKSAQRLVGGVGVVD